MTFDYDSSEKVILFVDPSPSRAAKIYQRMSDSIRNNTIWAKTAEEGIDILKNYKNRLELVFLEYDLIGDGTFLPFSSPLSGMEIIRFLESQNPGDYAQCKFILHSWNKKASKAMFGKLKACKYDVLRAPFGTI